MEAARRRQIQEWIVRFADGERDAFRPLFDALWPILLAFTSRALPRTSDAEDAAQAALMKVFSRIAEFDRTRDGAAWALGIAGFEVMTLRRRRARRKEAGSAALEPTADPCADAEARVIEEDLHQCAAELLGELSARDREALAHLFNPTGAEPARDETSRKRRFRAFERLRAAWRRAHG
jgi:RNA polymerase sigma-70 factor (ECF subfamily)